MEIDPEVCYAYSQQRLKNPVTLDFDEYQRDGIMIRTDMAAEEELYMREHGTKLDIDIDNLERSDTEPRHKELVNTLTEPDSRKGLQPVMDDDLLFNKKIQLLPHKDIEQYFTDVTDDGGVKKLMIKGGDGERPPLSGHFWIHYELWVEYNDEPIYVTKKPVRCQFFQPDIMCWLDLGVSMMERKEVSYFLIQSEYGYGGGGILDMVPPDSSLLCKVELVGYVEAVKKSITQTPDEDLLAFKLREVLAGVNDIKRVAAKSVSLQNWKYAYTSYNKAAHFLERCLVLTEEMQETRGKELFKIYNNLAFCAIKKENFTRAIYHCKKALQFPEEVYTESAKLYYRLSFAEFQLGQIDDASNDINKAQLINPYNEEINNLAKIIRKKIQMDKSAEKELLRRMFNSLSLNSSDDSGSDSFSSASSHE